MSKNKLRGGNMFTGLLLSYSLLFALFLLAILLPKFNVKNELTRKIIHIGISNWYFIAMIYFDNYLVAIIPPLSFIFLNYLSYRYKLIEGIERQNKKDLGTIYYPISLFLLVLFSFGVINKPYIGLIGTLILGYGDGIASIIGEKFGKTKIYKNKSYIGSLTMFIISFFTTFILLTLFNPINKFFYSLIIAFSATIIEIFSSQGTDNLTVPLTSSLLYYLLTLI